ncbi:MAG: helix-turn-helix transcriptional regulator [Coriobacteriales bacterium]|nr:helix-turn-helix transcriptional regulator [Coriobacteriales bacterium]
MSHLKLFFALALSLAILGFVMLTMVLSFAPGLTPTSTLPWICAGVFLLGLADAIVVLLLLGFIATFSLRNAYLHMVISNIIAVLIYYSVTFAPSSVLLPLAAVFFLATMGVVALAYGQRPAKVEEYSQPMYNNTLSRLWRQILGVCVLAFMAGLIGQISGTSAIRLEDFQDSSVLVSEVVYGALLIMALAFPRFSDLGRTYQIAIPISAIGFLLLPLVWNSAGGIVNSFANLGYMLALLVLTCLVVAVSRDTAISSYRLFALIYASAYLVQLIGMLIGRFNSSWFAEGTLDLTAIALVVIYLLSLVSLFIFRDKRFKSPDLDGDTEKVAVFADSGYSDRCENLAEKYDFTLREREVLNLLGQGNTVKAISEKLFISENTVKFHARSIYQKTGIHTRQDLINLIGRDR